MTRQQIKELRERMMQHKVVGDQAIVEITAKDLDELLDMAEEYFDNHDGWG